jgi:polyisoprenoid-binding protein YceI
MRLRGVSDMTRGLMPDRRRVLIAAACMLACAARGIADQRLVDAEKSTVTVNVFKSGMFKALADNHVIQAPLSDGSLDFDAPTPHVQVLFDARQLRVLDPGLSASDRQKVQARMVGPEVLDSERFSWISYHSLESRRVGSGRWEVKGELELHGTIRSLTVTLIEERGRYKGSTTFKQSDFGITPITIAAGTVRVKDEVRIDFDIVMR